MSKPVETFYTVGFHHLSVDVKKIGTSLPDAQLNYLSAKQVRGLLEAAFAIAPSVEFPAEPELRIMTSGAKFVVQIKAGGLNFISWSSSVKAGGKTTPAQIFDAISGADNKVDDASTGGGVIMGFAGGLLAKMNVGLLAVAIIAVNSFTFWFMSRPPKTLLPKFTVMQSEPAERLLADVAGIYETGGSSGDRRLEIKKDGVVERIKFNEHRVASQKQTYTVKAVDAGGKPALVTDRKSIITIKDPQSLVLFGDTYRRVMR